jgi:hypothetical protein
MEINSILEKGYDIVRDTQLEKLLKYDQISYLVENFVTFENKKIKQGDAEFNMLVPAGHTAADQDPYFTTTAHEPASTHMFIKHIEPEDTVWDIGSIVGYFSVLAANQNENPDKVHAFESSTLKCWLIEQQNKLLDGKIKINEAWISDDDTTGLMLDSYAKSTEMPDFVKIDIEGAEVPALRGMEETIKKQQPILLVEVHPNKIKFGYGSSDKHLLEWLSEYYNIRACERFRDQDFNWQDDWRPLTKGLHDLRWNDARVKGYEDRLSNPLGWIDWDSYQIVCLPEQDL